MVVVDFYLINFRFLVVYASKILFIYIYIYIYFFFLFSPTRPSGPNWSSSRDVRLFMLSSCPFPMQFFLRGRTGAERASCVDWCDLDLDLDLE